MNEKIPFKKDIIFKSIIGEITDITLTHDYLVKNDLVEGVFYLSGKYKMTEASVIEEEFFYNIPFSIAISDRIDKNTINITIDSFDYKINKDVMTINMNLNMNFENVNEEVKEIVMSDEKRVKDINSELELENLDIEKDIISSENEIKLNESVVDDINIINEENTISDNETNNILEFSKNNMNDNFTTYKVSIMRAENSIENILTKYNVTIDELKTINNLDNINVGDKILIPITKNE